MKGLPAIICCVIASAACARGADEWLDHLDESLAWSAAHDQVRARISGALDLEGYVFSQPVPGLVHDEGNALFNPRLSLFLDAQLGARVYLFAQSRLDRGFDPGEGSTQWRLDEYALRVSPWSDGRFNLQLGKFATVVGNWVARHQSWDNPFITAPLAYENLTGIFDATAAGSISALLRWAHVGPALPGSEYFDQYRVPIVWGPSYASGAAMSGVLGRFDYAGEIKNTSLSSRPGVWDIGHTQWQHPTFSARVGYRPDESWYWGVSASTGSYLLANAQPTLAPHTTLDRYRETVWAQDVAYAWHHVQFWAEAYEASFQIPRVGRAETVSYYLEMKYKFTAQLAGALRWNQQLYGNLADGTGGLVRWGRTVWRIDVAPSYRFSAHTELKLQYSLQSGGIGPRDHSELLATQFVLRF